jgi:hypothetical protein
MSKAELLQLIAALLGAFASIIAAIEGRLVKKFERASAKSPATAIEMRNLRLIHRWRLTRLEKAGAIAVTEERRYYFDQDAYKAFRMKRRVRVLSIVLPLILTILVALVLLKLR